MAWQNTQMKVLIIIAIVYAAFSGYMYSSLNNMKTPYDCLNATAQTDEMFDASITISTITGISATLNLVGFAASIVYILRKFMAANATGYNVNLLIIPMGINMCIGLLLCIIINMTYDIFRTYSPPTGCTYTMYVTMFYMIYVVNMIPWYIIIIQPIISLYIYASNTIGKIMADIIFNADNSDSQCQETNSYVKDFYKSQHEVEV